MREFFQLGVDGEFRYFSLAHIIPLLLMGFIIYLIYKKQTFLRTYKNEGNIRLVLAFMMIIADMSYFWQKIYLGANIKDHLPLTICGWAAIFGGFLLLSKSQFLFDINYFWVLAGSTNALITPAVITNSGPMHFRYYQFWIEHTSIYIALFYMICVFKMRPTFKSMVKSFVLLCILGALSIYANQNIEGANYLFLSTTEIGDSILNLLPSDLFKRLLVMGSLVLFLFILVYLPYFIKDFKTRKLNHEINLLEG
jgi:hypothetical integral membrane protein (TIGR02206 family)